MKCSFTIDHGQKFVAGNAVKASCGVLLCAALIVASTVTTVAQNPEMQQKLAEVKQAAALNQQALHLYQWTETTQLTLKGDPKPATQKLCQYGPDGQVQKTPIGAPPPPPSGGRLKKRVVANKTADITDYMDQVKDLLTMYVPPDPQKMDQAFQAGKASLNPNGGLVNLVFRDYSLPGDQMTLTFDTAAMKIISLSVYTYMGDSKDAVTLQVQMASLPDGTNYTQQTILNASAKQLVVTTTNANYQKLGGY